MADVFLSYAREDTPVACQLSEMLKAKGHRVFFDRAIAAGETYSEGIAKELAVAQAVIVLLSRNSNRSNWVQSELRHALGRGKLVIPVLLDEEATSNFVWPLVSDRQAIRLESSTEIAEVARQVDSAVGRGDRLETAAPQSARRTWLLFLVAALSALAGALAVWLTR